jgi:hypothetical protein
LHFSNGFGIVVKLRGVARQLCASYSELNLTFRVDGGPYVQEIDSQVLIIYEAPQDYWDYRDYPGGRGIPNAFRLEQVINK